jgi:hypothetical protein
MLFKRNHGFVVCLTGLRLRAPLGARHGKTNQITRGTKARE